MTETYKLSEVADNEMRQFAMYTIENRAIPNMIDGLKPVQRFYLYSSIVNSKNEFKKVSAVSGIISEYGYNHGEASAAGAGQLMAATWNNNICLVEGRGSFGTRQVQEAGAARYVYTKLHSNFNKYIKDIDLAPEHYDPEHTPPSFYIPVIPLVLANGIKGIATGFATNILPRSENDIIKACKEYLKTGTIKKRLNIAFPDFSGTVKHEVDNRFICTGTFKRPNPTKIIITEIPYGYDRESYVNILNKLEDENKIVDYVDQCSTNGFEFEVKLKNNVAKELNTNEKVLKLFKLSKAHNENLTVIDHEGKLREYDDERELIKDFIEYRLEILEERIKLRVTQLKEESRWLNVKSEFILGTLDNTIIFKNKTRLQVETQILKTSQATKPDCDRLLKINLLSLTKEMIVELKAKIRANNTTMKYWIKTTGADQFLSDLEL